MTDHRTLTPQILGMYLGQKVTISYTPTSLKIVDVITPSTIESCYSWTIMPHLRKLSDMTEEEATTLWEILDWNIRIPKQHRAADIIREFSIIETDDNDNTGNADWGSFLKVLPTMLSMGFDLFGLIDSGLAIAQKGEGE